MRLVIGADHAGFELKKKLVASLRASGWDLLDVGTHGEGPVDYPDFAEAVATPILDGRADRGILICGSGIGASVAANKIPGIRAGLCHDHYSAHQGVEHDDINVLVLGARTTGTAVVEEMVDAFLGARFSGEERHVRRLEKTQAIEERYMRGERGSK